MCLTRRDGTSSGSDGPKSGSGVGRVMATSCSCWRSLRSSPGTPPGSSAGRWRSSHRIAIASRPVSSRRQPTGELPAFRLTVVPVRSQDRPRHQGRDGHRRGTRRSEPQSTAGAEAACRRICCPEGPQVLTVFLCRLAPIAPAFAFIFAMPRLTLPDGVAAWIAFPAVVVLLGALRARAHGQPEARPMLFGAASTLVGSLVGILVWTHLAAAPGSSLLDRVTGRAVEIAWPQATASICLVLVWLGARTRCRSGRPRLPGGRHR